MRKYGRSVKAAYSNLCFLAKKSTFYEFFQSETTSKLSVPICFGQVGFPWESKHLISLARRASR